MLSGVVDRSAIRQNAEGPAGAGGGSAPAGRPASASSSALNASYVATSCEPEGSAEVFPPTNARRATSAVPSARAAAPTAIQNGSKSLSELGPERPVTAFPARAGPVAAASPSEAVAPPPSVRGRGARFAARLREPCSGDVAEPLPPTATGGRRAPPTSTIARYSPGRDDGWRAADDGTGAAR